MPGNSISTQIELLQQQLVNLNEELARSESIRCQSARRIIRNFINILIRRTREEIIQLEAQLNSSEPQE